MISGFGGTLVFVNDFLFSQSLGAEDSASAVELGSGDDFWV